MRFHEVANIFPLLEGEELQALIEDIRQNGQIEPIWTYEGKIIDGRNRYRACQQLGIEPKTREWNGTGSLVQFVVSLNLHRRHLSSSQKAVVAVDMLPILEKENEQIRREKISEYRQTGETSQIIEPSQKSTQQAAQVTGTNRQYVSDAKKIAQQAPEVLEKVREGVLTIPDANMVIALPVSERQEVINQVETRASKTVKEAIEKKTPHVAYNGGNNEWYTPAPYIEAARAVMGDIDLDPASSEIANRIVGAKQIYTVEDDGLTKDWEGKVWLNPPYAGELIPLFCDKIAAHYMVGEVMEAIILVNNATETGWFNVLIEQASAAVFPKGRVKFYTPSGVVGSPLQGQAVIYLGHNPDKFLQHFKPFGWGAKL